MSDTEASQRETRTRIRYTREFLVLYKDKHTVLEGGVEKLGDLHIENMGAMNLQQLRSQSSTSRYQFSRLINPHPDDSSALRSPTRGGHHSQGHSPLAGHNSGRFNSSSFAQSREDSARRGEDARWDAHKSLDLGRRDGGGGNRESSGNLSSSLPSNSSSRWVKTEGDGDDDWRSRKGSTRGAWQDGSGQAHLGSSSHTGHDGGGGNPVWADVSVDPSQSIEMHGADVIEQERQKMKDLWRKQAEEKKLSAGTAMQQEEVGDDEIEMWKAEQEKYDGQNRARGVQDALLKRKEEVMQREDQIRRTSAEQAKAEADAELRARMAGMAMSSGNPNGGLEGKNLLAMLGGGPNAGPSGGPLPSMRPGVNMGPNMMHPGMHPGGSMPHNVHAMQHMQNVQNMQSAPLGMNLPPPNMRLPPGFNPGMPMGQVPQGMMYPGMPMPPNMRPGMPVPNTPLPNMPPGGPPSGPPGGPQGGIQGGSPVPMGGPPPHGMIRPGQQLNVAALFGNGAANGAK